MDLISVFAKNPLAFTIGAGLVGGLTMRMGKVFPHCWRLLREQICTSLTVYGDDDIFYNMSVWLSKRSYVKKARSVTATEVWDWRADKWIARLVPGVGWHSFKYRGSRIFLYRSIEDAPGPTTSFSKQKREKMYIYTLGRSHVTLNALLAEMQDIREDKELVPIYIWNNGRYEMAQHREARPLDTIFLPEAQKNRLVQDFHKFTHNRDWYRQRGIPYRRGYMLEGPPGTGKSSVVFALAGHFHRPIYIINPQTLENDNVLQRAVNDVKHGGVLLIEDIDAIKITEQRKEPEAKAEEPSRDGPIKFGEAASPEKAGITLSGLLNAIDGVVARDGRLLFITTNHAANLDAALIRPGRVDVREYLGLMELPEARAMFKCFWPKEDVEVFSRWVEPQLPMSPAAMQNLLLAYEPKAEDLRSTIHLVA